ncbi:hypothetical protein [Treponema sp. R6D11]
MTAIVLLLIVTCVENTDEPDSKIDDDVITYGPVNFDALNVTGEQVWMPNYNTGKVSQLLLKFEGDRTVDVVVELVQYDGGGNPSFLIKSVGSGEIEKGILSFKVDEDEVESNLLDSDDLLKYYFNDWYVDVDGDGSIDITVEPTTVKGNIITLVSQKDSSSEPVEAVIREGFSGTNNSLTGQYIYYLYVEADCTISSKKVKNTDLDYKFKDFNLSLKAGWNTICKNEKYTTTGKSCYSITVSNPSIKWVMQKIKSN